MQLDDLAESDAHARWVVANHVGNGTERPRCVICDTWWPCDLVGLAALVVLWAEKAGRWREQLRIAEEFLETLAGRKRGEAEPYPGHDMTHAEDALIQMSVVE